MRNVSKILLLITISIASAFSSGQAGPNDWQLSYEFELVNPTRKLIEVQAEFTFPVRTGDVVFQMDDEDQHYTEGYRRHLKVFALVDSDSNRVDFTTDTIGVYRASGLKGTYRASYTVTLGHIDQQSKLGPDDTPLLWGNLAVFPGASVVVYPRDAGGSRVGNIEIAFKKPAGAVFVTPYEKIGDSRYRVPDISLLKSEFWFLGDFETFEIETGGDTLICGIAREGLRFGIDDIRPKIESIADYYVSMFGSLPSNRVSMSIMFTPTSARASGFHSFATVGTRSINCLIDEKVRASDLDSQMGLLAYNFLSFWTPGQYRPAAADRLDWFTVASLNYMQVKTLLKLGFISDEEFFERIARAYNTYDHQLGRKGLSLTALSMLPASDERSVYGFMVCVMLDMTLNQTTDGEKGLEDVMQYLSNEYGGGSEYDKEGLYYAFSAAGLTNVRSLVDKHVEAPTRIDLGALLKDYGFAVSKKGTGAPDIGMLLRGSNDLTVDWVRADGAAKKAGIEFGDVLSEMRGFKLNKASDLGELISNMKPGDKVNTVFIRNGDEHEVTIELGERSAYQIEPAATVTGAKKAFWNKFKTP